MARTYTFDGKTITLTAWADDQTPRARVSVSLTEDMELRGEDALTLEEAEAFARRITEAVRDARRHAKRCAEARHVAATQR